MDHSRHSKRHRSRSKSKKGSTKTKRRSRERNENGNNSGNEHTVVSVQSQVVKPLVEYSDVSSEDLSGPEAGEIQSEESPSFSDLSGHHRNVHHKNRSRTVLDDDYRHLSSRKLPLSPGRRRIIPDTALISRSPSPLNERKHSVSSDVSRSSSMRHRKRHDGSPLGFSTMRHVIDSPNLIDEYDIRRHRKKKEKKHKRDKKASKKKKKKSKHRSRSSSPEDGSEKSPDSPKKNHETTELLSDWEPGAKPPPYRPPSLEPLDNVICSPVSPPSNHTSPVHEQISPTSLSPRAGTPPQPPPVSQRKFYPADSPHTPQLPAKAYEVTKIDDEYDSSYSGRKHLSPILSETRHSYSPIREDRREPSWNRQHSLSPVKSSPFRNPSPDVQIISSGSMSPSRKRRRMEKEIVHSHRRHRKEKERVKDRRRISRSRSPIRRHRSSRSPSWNRSRHYSRSSSRTRSIKRYRSRTPNRRIPSPRSPRSPRRYFFICLE